MNVEDNELLLCWKVEYYLRVGLKTGVRYKIMWFKTRHRGLVFEDYVEIGYGHGQMLGTTQMKLIKAKFYQSVVNPWLCKFLWVL